MNFEELFGNKEVFKISHMGEPKWEVRQHLKEPANEAAIENAAMEIGIDVPEMIRVFWRFSSGAELYRSEKDPLWGWKIFGTEKYLEGQHKYRRKFFNDWRPSYLTIAELMNPVTAVVWDGRDEKIYFLDTGTGYMNAVCIAENVEDFFHKLKASDGGLFWKW